MGRRPAPRAAAGPAEDHLPGPPAYVTAGPSQAARRPARRGVPPASSSGSSASDAAAVAPTSARLCESGSSSTPSVPGRWIRTGTYSRVWCAWPIVGSLPWSPVTISRSPGVREQRRQPGEPGVHLLQHDVRTVRCPADALPGPSPAHWPPRGASPSGAYRFQGVGQHLVGGHRRMTPGRLAHQDVGGLAHQSDRDAGPGREAGKLAGVIERGAQVLHLKAAVAVEAGGRSVQSDGALRRRGGRTSGAGRPRARPTAMTRATGATERTVRAMARIPPGPSKERSSRRPDAFQLIPGSASRLSWTRTASSTSEQGFPVERFGPVAGRRSARVTSSR